MTSHSKESITVYVEIPVVVELSHYRGYHGTREKGSGVQLEPDEPPSTEIEDFYPESDSSWEDIIQSELEKRLEDGEFAEQDESDG